MEQLTVFPSSFVAGDYFNLKESLADYPASDSWELSYVLINSAAKITITSAASGDDHLMQVAASTTSDWTVGTYSWQKRISNGTEIYTLDVGQIEIRPSFSAQTTYDDRSHVKKTLDAIESVIEGKASKDVQSYQIEGRSISRYSVTELLEWRDKYRALYRAELVREGKAKSRRNIKTKFVRIS